MTRKKVFFLKNFPAQMSGHILKMSLFAGPIFISQLLNKQIINMFIEEWSTPLSFVFVFFSIKTFMNYKKPEKHQKNSKTAFPHISAPWFVVTDGPLKTVPLRTNFQILVKISKMVLQGTILVPFAKIEKITKTKGIFDFCGNLKNGPKRDQFWYFSENLKSDRLINQT